MSSTKTTKSSNRTNAVFSTSHVTEITRIKSNEGQTVDALASSAEEGRGTLREAVTRRVQPQQSQISEWGNPAGVIPRYLEREGNRAK